VRVKRTKGIRIKLKNLIKISKIRERMNPPIPLVMRIIIIFDWRMEFCIISLGIKNFIQKSIGGQIILNSHWFLKDEEAMNWKGRFLQLPWDKVESRRRGLENLGGEEFLVTSFYVIFLQKLEG
jgi:hypothetical protein